MCKLHCQKLRHSLDLQTANNPSFQDYGIYSHNYHSLSRASITKFIVEVEAARPTTGHRMPRQHGSTWVHMKVNRRRERGRHIHRSFIQCNHNKQQDCAMCILHVTSTANSLQQRIYGQQIPLVMETYSHTIAEHNIFPRHSTRPLQGQHNTTRGIAIKNIVKKTLLRCRTSKQQV